MATDPVIDPVCVASPSVQLVASAIAGAKLLRTYCSMLTEREAIDYVIQLKKASTGTVQVGGTGERLWAFAGPPDDSIGVDGDSWLDLETSNVYLKQNGTYK